MGKNIVICCDGTGNQYGRRNTNVVELFDIAEKNCDRQVAFYDPGVGTFSSIAAVTRIAKAFTKLMGLAIAYGITRNIEEGGAFFKATSRTARRCFFCKPSVSRHLTYLVYHTTV